MQNTTAPKTRLPSGQAGENKALDYLIKQGLVLVARNFSSRMGEIDLIMKDRDTLVFIEVRKRSKGNFGGAVASITRAKQQRLVKTAQLFLQKTVKTPPSRFDVVALDGDDITWLKNVIDEM
ncbi:YraN family protein [Oxalobacter vibrioformis]|uniref:UPF0102 protein NB640_07260 n=1 Tax=Oxalobacter vibrioformis TaxID=933080 RepID=A0A9E9LX67_9BURK|nr:YraN family protein [Oxalobacter vibrioformis]NLC24228.1 YraN family protein [Oxalobacter sp.]WAW09084.1 YraN family protein [Oxalobacter vibrioformis]